MDRYALLLLGRFELLRNDTPVPVRAAHRRVLSVLAINPGDAVERDRLIGELWGEQPPPSAKNALQVHVSAIRKLAPGSIETTSNGYRLSPFVETDVAEFQLDASDALRRTDDPDWENVLSSCSTAIEKWHGAPYDEIPESTEASPIRARLTEQYLEILERRAEALLSLGREEEVVAELEELVRQHPLRERLWEYLMLGRYRLGRQADALRAFRELSTILGEELGIEPGTRLKSLEEAILMQLPEAQTGGAATPHNLSVLTSSFIGRRDATQRVAKAISENPIVSLVGGPGVGKSRLASEVAWRLISEFPAGVYVVSLAGAANASDVAAEIVATVGSSEVTSDLEMIARGLCRRPMLLILDNCEHVVAPVNVFCSAVAGVSGQLRVLTTTRRKIGIVEEHVELVSPLAVPDDAELDPETLLASPSVRLLMDRARMHATDFRPTDLQPAAIAAIVRQADGVPLALEMAARWISSVGLEEFRDLRDLVEDETIDGAIELSVRLMSPADRQFFYSASVFAGKATLRTIGIVCAPGESLIEAAGSATRLVESSLLVNELGPSGRMTYSMLQPVREFARRYLDRSGDTPEITERMVERYRSVAPTFDTETADAIDRAMPDLRQSLRWLLDRGDVEGAETIANALAPYWVARYLTWEADRWFVEILGQAGSNPSLETLWNAGWVAFNGNEYATAGERYERLRSLAVDATEPLYEGRALYGLARMDLPIDRTRGIETLVEALEVFRSTNSRADIGECLMALGFGYVWMGQPEPAKPFLEEGYAIGESEGDHRLMAQCRRFGALGAYFEDDQETALRYAAESREAAAKAADTRVLGGARIQSALVEARWGELAIAARYIADALLALPEAATIDTALVFVGAIPVLVEGGDTELAAEVFSHIDAIAASRGWQPIHTVNPMVAKYRAKLRPIEPPSTDLLKTRASVQAALEDMAIDATSLR
jgi:DNA-binding SARP family transcriptional activator